jgi:hypothetical protein
VKKKINKNEINEDNKLINKVNELNETKATDDNLEKQKEEEDKLTENSEIIKHDQIKDNIGESDNQSQ